MNLHRENRFSIIVKKKRDQAFESDVAMWLIWPAQNDKMKQEWISHLATFEGTRVNLMPFFVFRKAVSRNRYWSRHVSRAYKTKQFLGSLPWHSWVLYFFRYSVHSRIHKTKIVPIDIMTNLKSRMNYSATRAHD